MSTKRDLLIAARDKIADPKHWTKGALARDDRTIDVNPKSSVAVCFCAVGAIEAVAPSSLYVTVAYNILTKAIPDRFGSIPAFNDHRSTTHADVIRAYDRAIESCE